MYDRVTALEIIDRAYDDQPFCATCGAQSALRNDGDLVVLECSASGGSGLLTRIGDFLIPHTRRIVIDLSDGIAA